MKKIEKCFGDFQNGIFIILGKQKKGLTFAEALVYQSAFTCSKSTMGKPEQCVKSVQNWK